MAFHNLSLSLDLPATLVVADGGAATAALLCIFFSFFFIWFLQKRRISARLPPGPYAWPIIGNLHQLRLPAHRSLKGLADKYGPIFFLRLGSVPAVVISSSEIAKQFLKTHDLIFASRPPRAAGRLMFFNSKDVIFAPYGDYWRQMRKICVLELLTPKRIESFKHVREEEVSAMIRSIWEESERGGTSVNVSKAISTLNSNIIWRILAKRKFSDDDLGGDFKGFKDLLVDLTGRAGDFNIGDYIPYLDWFDLQGINRRMKMIHKTFDEFAEKMIDEHVNLNHLMAAASNGQKEADSEPRVQDFVDVLLHMAEADTKITRETIKALLLDMFAGGAETTATTLEWAMSELLRHPNVMKRLQEEIESIVGHHGKVKESNLATMKYLHCVMKETLRLYPAGPLMIPHESVEAVTVGGYYIPKKTTVMVNVWAIGRDPNVWGAYASDFKPERFMEDEHINLTDQSDFSMIPFGAGRRGCPGASMAIPTIELALAQLLHTFDWRVEGDPSRLDMTEMCGVSIPRQVPLCAYPFRGGFLSPHPFEDLWVSLLMGWVVEAMVHDVVLLGVMVGDWTFFSLNHFPYCLYNSVVVFNVSTSQSSKARVFSSLSLSLVRHLWIKELLNPTNSKCSRKIPLGLNPLSLSTYFRFKFLKWRRNSSILLTFLNTKSPTFQGTGMNYFFLLPWKKCNQ